MKKQNMCSSDDDCNECSKECLKWMHSEYKEQILNDEEKDIIKLMINVIHKLGCEVICVYKSAYVYGYCFVYIKYKNELCSYIDKITSPWFKNNKFKGMEPCKEYTIEELGITCQTQKDS